MSAQASNPSSLSVRQLLAIRDFRLLWSGQIISNLGDALTQLTLVLYLNRLTGGSTTAIAGLLVAVALPQATLGMVAGVFVDRLDRKRVMIVSDVLRGLLVLALLAVVGSGNDSLWPIYVLAFFHALVGAFFMPARTALLPHIVPADGLLSANALSQTTLVLARVLGAAAAGFLVGVLDLFWPAFAADGLTFFLSALFIAAVAAQASRPTVPESHPTAGSLQAFWRQLTEGLALLRHNRVLMGVLIAAGVAMLGLGAVNVLLAPYVVNDLGLPETWFGAIEAVQVAGMVLSGALVALLSARFRANQIVSNGMIALGVVVALMALADRIWILFPVLFAVGLVATPINAAIATLVQTAVADEARGRISSALGALVQTASLLSMMAAGSLAAWLGNANVFIFSGAVTVLAGLLAAWAFHSFTMETPPGAETQAQAAAPASGS